MSISSKASSGGANNGKIRSRRNFINQTIGGMAFLGASGGGVMPWNAPQDNSGKAARRKLKIIVTGGHPIW